MRPGLALAAGLGLGVAIAGGDAEGAQRYSLFPERSSLYAGGGGCSTFSGVSPCGTRRLPAPVGDPTDGPLTEDLRRGPLDPKPDPLGLDAELPMPRNVEPQRLPSQKR